MLLSSAPEGSCHPLRCHRPLGPPSTRKSWPAFRAEPASRTRGLVALGAQGQPPPQESLGSPSIHMQSSKHLLLRPRLWGVQRCSRRSQQVPVHTASTHSAKLPGPTHRRAHSPPPTGDPSSPWQGHALAGWAIWCTRLPTGTTDGYHGQGPRGAGGRDPSCPRWAIDSSGAE